MVSVTISSDSSVSNRFQQVVLFLIFKGAVIAVKLDVLALVTCFAVPHPTNAKKAKQNVNGFNGIHLFVLLILKYWTKIIDFVKQIKGLTVH
jgi:hypothetical protein